MTLADRITRFFASIRRAELRRQHPWKVNAAAKQFVSENWHVSDIDKLTDRAILHGIYSKTNPRSTVRWRMERIRDQLGSSHSPTSQPLNHSTF